MSAVNLTSSESETEALRHAQRAHEPSMEKILASIRSIIAEGRAPLRAAGYAPSHPAAPASSQFVQLEDAQQEMAGVKALGPDQSARTADAPSSPPSHSPNAKLAESANRDELTSPETREQMLAAFATLSAGLRARSAELAEAMVRELIRPMLKAWLDEHLPGVVERLVRAELNRISRSLR